MQYLINILITTVITTIIGGVIASIVKGFFDDMKTQVKSAVDTIGNAKKEFNDKIEQINKDQRNIYDSMLMKFSNWEDRIKKIIDDTGNLSFNKPDADFKTHILQSFADLDMVIKKDIISLKKGMQTIEDDLKELQDHHYDKDIVKQIINSVARMNTQKNKDILRIEDKILKIYSIVKVLISDQKKLEGKFKTYTEAMSTKVRLFEQKK